PTGGRQPLQVGSLIRLDDPTGHTQYQTGGFTTNRGACADPCTLTADPDITEANLQISVTYLVRVVFATCGSDSPGTVIVGGSIFTCSGSFYASTGTLSLQATPSPLTDGTGSPWIFVGWYSGLGNDSQAFFNTATVTGPMSIYPRLTRGRKITIQSSPPGLKVLADRSSVATPTELIWGRSTTHTLGSVPDQIDNHGKLWVVDSWRDRKSVV